MVRPSSHWLMHVRPMELAALLKRVLRVRRQPCTAAGIEWSVDPVSDFGDRLRTTGTYEPTLTAAIEALLRPGDVCVDVGANEGWFSVAAAQAVGPTGRVLAVEPQARLWPVLRELFGRNGLTQADLIPAALGAADGDGDLILYPSTNSGATSLVPTPRTRRMPRQAVPVYRFDALATREGLTAVQLMKIDVEGFERDVLDGCGDWLDGRIRYLSLETHPEALAARGESREAVEGWLRDRGYVPEVWRGAYLWRWHAATWPQAAER